MNATCPPDGKPGLPLSEAGAVAPAVRSGRLLHVTLLLAIGLASAYLCLANLDYVTYWHDEGPTAVIARNLLEQGDITGWDGRNLVGGTNGRTLNSRLQDVLPPLMYGVSAAGISMIGFNEIGARLPHALLGLLALGVLYLLLRQRLTRAPGLVLLCFLFAALSPQLLLYFRQSRYYAAAVLLTLSAFWLYERHWRTGQRRVLVALILVLSLAFFNHYTTCAATLLALLAYHLLLRARATSRAQWAEYALGGAFIGALALAYLYHMELLGGERHGYGAYTGVVMFREPHTLLPTPLFHIKRNVITLFTADWLSWLLCLWLVLALCGRHGGRLPPHAVTEVGKLALFGLLFTIMAGLLNMQPTSTYPTAEIRYLVPALPLLLPVKGLFVAWVWRRYRPAGALVLALLLCTSVGASPFNLTNRYTSHATIGAHLFEFVREIHSDYPDANRQIAAYLLEHAGQDDLVLIGSFALWEALTPLVGHRVLFTCVLDEASPLPERFTRSPAARHLHCEQPPDWFIVAGLQRDSYWAGLADFYEVAADLNASPHPLRPELDHHNFKPLPYERGIRIFRRKGANSP